MKLHSKNIEDHERLAVLTFERVNVLDVLESYVNQDNSVDTYVEVQVVMVQGISSDWKQPIFIDFDAKMNKYIIYNIIEKLENIGYKIICCVTSCSVRNSGLWAELGVSYENPSFVIPNGRKVVCIPDSHHLLKIIRKWFLETGFSLNGKEITKKPLDALITKVPSSVSPRHNLKRKHLSCVPLLQHNFKLAKQLLSYSTATAIQHYRPIEDFELLNNTSQFIALVSNWFELVNVPLISDCCGPFDAPYGIFLYKQDQLLNKMYDTFASLRCIGKDHLEQFQYCILMHINGTKELLHILKENGLNCLITSKISKAPLNNIIDQFFSGEVYPTRLNVEHKLRMIILGQCFDTSSVNSNAKDNNDEEFIIGQLFKQANINSDKDSEDSEDSENSDRGEESEESDESDGCEASEGSEVNYVCESSESGESIELNETSEGRDIDPSSDEEFHIIRNKDKIKT